MVLFTLISLVLSPGQDGAVPYAAPLYVAPSVRPFEPPSSFGRASAEGDGDGGRLRRPLVTPVVVEAYRGSYEYAPSGAETAYDAGVANAERAMDARMGPLDGLWRLQEVDGHVLMTLSLSDPGETRPVEGAFRTADAAAEIGPLSSAGRTAEALILELDGGRLSLGTSDEGWTGVLSRGGQERAVTLVR
jgi:hypothetical protein